MITRCEVTETAVELSLQLEVYVIPSDFEPDCDGQMAMAHVRDRFTNFRQLLESLPRCPLDCPILHDTPMGSKCSGYEFVYGLLEREARLLAAGAYNAWRVRKQQMPAQEKSELSFLSSS